MFHRPRSAMSRLVRGADGLRDDSGVAAVIFAIAIVPIVIVIGAAVDYQRAVSTRARLQTAVDAAVLAAVKSPNSSERLQVARDVVSSNVADLSVGGLQQVFTNNSDGSFTGTLKGSASTAFMGIVNVRSMDLAVTARAAMAAGPPNTPTTLNFSLRSVKGWYRKDVTLWVHYAGNPTDTALATFVYQPTSLFGGGTGPTTGPLGTTITLGSNYDKLYLTMDVYRDGCGPGKAPEFPNAIDLSDTNYWEPYNCIPVNPPYVTKVKTPFKLSTDDPATSNHLFVDGVQQPFGAPLNVLNFAKCNASVTHGWEDTKDWVPSDPDNVDAWSSQDLIFTVTGGSCAPNTAMTGVAGTPAPRLLN